MRYSLRTLLIAICVFPLLLAVAYWTFWPEPGSQRSMRAFLWAIDTGDRERVESAARNCFIVGAPAKAYQSTLGYLPKETVTPSGTEWWFSTQGDIAVVVLIGGNPEVIQGVKFVAVVN